MGSDERNFRSSYYEKVGCYSVEEKKSLNKLLSDNIRNQSKLKQFCLNYTVPTTSRNILWNILLGVLPLHKNSTDYIKEQRTCVYDDLQRAITVMEYIDAETTPKSRKLYCMWLMEKNYKCYPPKTSKVEEADEHNFEKIVKVLLQIFDDDVETFWIAKEFYTYIEEIEHEAPKLKEFTQTLLKREDIALHNHLEKLGVYSAKSILDKWYTTCFAGVISESSLVKVWDKICGGSRKIVIFIFLELVKALRESVMNCNNQKDFKTLIEQVKDQDAVIVNKAIKTWQSNKTHNEITVH